MRLDSAQRNALKAAFKALKSGDKAFLFGSRVDDLKRGGDIDLLVYSQQSGFGLSRKLSRIFFKNCEEKIDILVVDPEDMTEEQHRFISTLKKTPLISL